MSELAGDQRGDVFLLGQIAKEAGDYFVLIRRYEEAAEEYEEAIAACDMIAHDSPAFAEARKLGEIARKHLDELKGGFSQGNTAKRDFSFSLTDKFRELGETLKDIVSPGIQWNLAFCMGTEEDDEKTSIRLPRMLRVSGDRKGDEVCLDIGSVIISSGMEQISHEILTRFLERLNSGKETFYYQVLLNDSDRGWSAFPDEPGEIYDLEIPVRDTVPDCFVLLLDTKSESLRDSTGNVMRFLEHSDEKSAMEISSSTLVMFVETDKN